MRTIEKLTEALQIFSDADIWSIITDNNYIWIRTYPLSNSQRSRLIELGWFRDEHSDRWGVNVKNQ